MCGRPSLALRIINHSFHCQSSVVAMADGFARSTGRAALCSLHTAAGVGHAMGSIYTAYRNHTPLVIVAGQQARSLLPFQPFLGADSPADLPKPYVKFAIEPARAEDVPAAIARAYNVAMTRPCGPTFVSIPSDDWSVLVEPWGRGGAVTTSRDVAPDPVLLKQLADELNAAGRPVLVYGTEVDDQAAGEAAVSFAEKTKCPVFAGPFASRVAFPENHPQFAGHLAAAPNAISAALADFDLIVVIGGPAFTFHVPGTFRVQGRIWQVTSDPTAAATCVPGTNSIVGSMNLALGALVELVESPTSRTHPDPRPIPPAPAPSNPIPAAYLFHALSKSLPKNTVIAEETPSHRPLVQKYLAITSWSGFFTMTSGSLGYSLPAAVGISLATQKRVAALIGDGSMMYSIQALWSAAQRKVPLLAVVVNNAGYGAMRSIGAAMGVSGVPGIELPGLEFVDIARGMGVPGRKVDRWEDLSGAIEWALGVNGPTLLDVVVEREVPMLYNKPA